MSKDRIDIPILILRRWLWISRLFGDTRCQRKVMGRKNKFSKGTPFHATKKFAYQTFREFIASRRITASLTLLSLELS